MDKEWKSVYDSRACRDIPDYQKACWTKEGFEELLYLTLKFVDELNSESTIESILDLGCGPGVYCHSLNLKGYSIIGIDYSENMISLAKSRYPGISFLVGNGYALEFPESNFDLVLSIGTLQCLREHETFIKELSRVAKKYILISTLWRDDTGVDPKIILERQLREDSWPTREYHPSEIVPLLESEGFSCTIIRENEGKEIRDGYFIIARK